MLVKVKNWRGKTIDVHPLDIEEEGNQPISLNDYWIDELKVENECFEIGDGFYEYLNSTIEYVHELQILIEENNSNGEVNN